MLVCAQNQSRQKVSAIVLLVYGDESLDETQNRVCAVAGVAGLEPFWVNLEEKWQARTAGVPFHANDCDSDQGDYAPSLGEHPDERHKANKALYKDLIMLLASSGLGGFASVYDLAAQRSAFPPPFNPAVYYQPFLDVIEAMRNAAAGRDDIAELIFDSRMESQHNAGLIYANLREDNPQWRDRLASKISFECSRENLRLQAADLFAREAMKVLDNKVGPVHRPLRKSWEALKGTKRFLVAAHGEAYFEELKRDINGLQAALGFTPDDFHAWLETTNRVNNITAYIEFMHLNRGRLTDQQIETIGSRFRPAPEFL